MRWGISIGAVVVALLLPAQAAQGAQGGGDLKLGMAFRFLTTRPDVTQQVVDVAPSLDSMALGLDWSEIQPDCGAIRDGEFLWDKVDAAMQIARDLNKPVIATLIKGPKCTSPGKGTEPKGKWLRKWTKFAGKVAQRYGSDPVTQIEVWSEPNLHSFGGDASDYADMFLKTEKAISRKDRKVKTLVGGLGFCCGPHLFVKQLYKSKAMQKRGRHVAAHTYSPSAEVAVERLRKVRKAMPKRGDITVTEHGWATCPKPTITKQRKCVTPARQKAQMKEYIRLLEQRRRSLDVLGFYWFQAMDFSYPEIVEDCPDDPKNFFGIWTRNGEAKPSHQAWETLSGVDLPETVAQNPLGTRPCQDRN